MWAVVSLHCGEVAVHRAWLMLGWETISACYQPPRSTQPGHPFVVGAVSTSVSGDGNRRSGVTLAVRQTLSMDTTSWTGSEE